MQSLWIIASEETDIDQEEGEIRTSERLNCIHTTKSQEISPKTRSDYDQKAPARTWESFGKKLKISIL